MTPGRWSALEALVGLAIMAAGVSMWSLPAALVLVGAVVFALAIWPRRP